MCCSRSGSAGSLSRTRSGSKRKSDGPSLWRRRALGNKIRLGETALEVIGVVEKKGNFMGPFSTDNHVIIPMQLFISGFQRWPDVQIQVKVIDLRQLDDAKEELRGVLRKIRRVP